MKTSVTLFAAAATLSAGLAQAHFQLLYTPEMLIEEPTELPLRLVFGHPMENGHTMDMGQPEQFFVVFKGEKTDLLDNLQPVTWTGAHNQGKAYAATYKIRRNGDYAFALIPAPYYEASEDIFIQQVTKLLVNKGGMPTGWNEPLGLPTEIVPMTKPYQTFVGGTFSGQVLSDGKPAAGVECEIESINTDVDLTANAFGKTVNGPTPATTIVAVTDANGVFTFGIPAPGIWGFACLGAGPNTQYQGKELSQDAVLWINAADLKTPDATTPAAEAGAVDEHQGALDQDQIRELQQALSTIGLYEGRADGVAGPATLAALELFQRSHGQADRLAPSSAILDQVSAAASQL